MIFYINVDSGGYGKFSGEGMSLADGMSEVTEDVFNQHVLDVAESSSQAAELAMAEKQKAVDILVDSLVSATNLTHDQVRAAL